MTLYAELLALVSQAPDIVTLDTFAREVSLARASTYSESPLIQILPELAALIPVSQIASDTSSGPETQSAGHFRF